MSDSCNLQAKISRRSFLFLSGGALALVAMPPELARAAAARGLSLVRVSYPRQKIGRLSALQLGRPVAFQYPHQHPNCSALLYKLGAPAGGGIGPDGDVVAFNNLCTHQGSPIPYFDAVNQVAGPCPLHLTTFDLTRHGMVISGHATDGLPQVVLELDGDDIYATGMMGLIFGFHNNEVIP
ncbi:MAG: arsenate reductase (azurin) small subunit [Anaerolineae bacterium]|jgi:arsenite oxidase small subunit|nr:arsenate reductase (azurin) small subunit [Anaerolineae bacterium]